MLQALLLEEAFFDDVSGALFRIFHIHGIANLIQTGMATPTTRSWKTNKQTNAITTTSTPAVPFPMELVGVKEKLSSRRLSSSKLMEVGGSGEGFSLERKEGRPVSIGVNSWYVGELRHLATI